jgi:hypothetical protein
LFYKTEHGAFIGDMFMSLIHTCNPQKVNPFDYLTALHSQCSLTGNSPMLQFVSQVFKHRAVAFLRLEQLLKFNNGIFEILSLRHGHFIQVEPRGILGRVESRYDPALLHQTVRAVSPYTAFRCSSLQGMHFLPDR